MNRKFFAILTMSALLLCAVPMWAQFSLVKGKVIDETGKPMAEAVLDFHGKETGRKYNVKTDKNGEYRIIAVAPGKYTITLSKDGQKLWEKEATISFANPENDVSFDLKTDRAQAAKQGAPQMTEEQKKEMAAITKENEKIKGLNAMLQQASAAQQAGNHDQAVEVMTQATQIDPTRDLLWFRLGDFQLAKANELTKTDRAAAKPVYEAAASSYQKAIELAKGTTAGQAGAAPKTPAAMGAYYNNLGQALSKAGKIDDAVKAYEAAAQTEPANGGQYYFNMGAVLTNSGRTEEANAAFDKAIAADPNKAEAYYWRGVNLMAKATTTGNKMVAPDGTAEAFNKYLELQPEGAYAQASKEMLAMIGAEIQTSFKKAGTKKK